MAFMGIFGALGFGRFGYSAVLPAMQKGLHISSAAAGSLASWNLVGYTVMSAVGGVLLQKWGPRKVITAGILLTAVGMLATGFVHTLAGASAAPPAHRRRQRPGAGAVDQPDGRLVRIPADWAWRPPSSRRARRSPWSWWDWRCRPSSTPAGTSGWRITWYVFAGVDVRPGGAQLLAHARPAGRRRGAIAARSCSTSTLLPPSARG